MLATDQCLRMRLLARLTGEAAVGVGLCLCLTLANGLAREVSELRAPTWLSIAFAWLTREAAIWVGLRLRLWHRLRKSLTLARLAREAAVWVGLGLWDGLRDRLRERLTLARLTWETAVGVRDGSAVDSGAKDGGSDGGGELHND